MHLRKWLAVAFSSGFQVQQCQLLRICVSSNFSHTKASKCLSTESDFCLQSKGANLQLSFTGEY